jgi:transcriptional regulator with XRE-family HTH domain
MKGQVDVLAPLALLKTLRVSRGLTQRELGLRVGVSRDLISLLERGRRPANRALVRRIARALGVPMAVLTTGRVGATLVAGGHIIIHHERCEARARGGGA